MNFTKSRDKLVVCNFEISLTYSSARTMRQRVAFSIAYLVRPFFPAIRPIARERLSPFNGLTRKQNERIKFDSL